jgi:hypothetical protein
MLPEGYLLTHSFRILPGRVCGRRAEEEVHVQQAANRSVDKSWLRREGPFLGSRVQEEHTVRLAVLLEYCVGWVDTVQVQHATGGLVPSKMKIVAYYSVSKKSFCFQNLPGISDPSHPVEVVPVALLFVLAEAVDGRGGQ